MGSESLGLLATEFGVGPPESAMFLVVKADSAGVGLMLPESPLFLAVFGSMPLEGLTMEGSVPMESLGCGGGLS